MRILIVKLSSLGDVVHAMAAVQDIVRAHPQAVVDWVVEPAFAPLVRRCRGVHRVIPCDLRRWRQAPWAASTRRAWAAFRHELRAQAYYWVIDLQGLSKSALIAWQARLTPQGRRVAMGNATEGSSYEAPTRWVAHVAVPLPAHCHAVTRARLVCAAALQHAAVAPAEFGLVAHPRSVPDELALQALRGGYRGIVLLVHGTTRQDKMWPLPLWRSLAQRLGENGYAVALPQGSDAELEAAQAIAAGYAHAQVWPRMPLDALLDAMGVCSGVIGVDSGLSHIAVALNLPHIQIYNFDTAWRTGPLEPPHAGSRPRALSVFAQPHPGLDAVWSAWRVVAPEGGAQAW